MLGLSLFAASWLSVPCVVTAQGRAASRVAREEDHARAEALALFEAGVAAYRAGRYESAIERFQAAYSLSPEPVLLYNLARAQDRAEQYEAAVESYRRYLSTESEIEDREEITRRIAELEAARTPVPPPVEEERATPLLGPPPAAASEGPTVAPAPWLIAGGGILFLAVGGLLGGIGQGRYDAAAATMVHADRLAWQDEANGLATGANVLFVAGGVLAVAGAVWGIVDLVTWHPSSDSEARVEIDPSHVALHLRF